MKIRLIAMMLAISVTTAAHAANVTLTCEFGKLDPASLADNSKSVTDGSKHFLEINFAREMKPNAKTGGFRIDLPSVAITDPDNLFLGARLISAGMTKDREMLFFVGETKSGDLIQIPVPKSSKESGVWNAAVSLGRGQSHVFMGTCGLTGLPEAVAPISEPKL
jgi:hypothetical protein